MNLLNSLKQIEMPMKERTIFVLKRDPKDCFVNNYNADVLIGWQANHDIQFVLNPYACIMYIESATMFHTDQSFGH